MIGGPPYNFRLRQAENLRFDAVPKYFEKEASLFRSGEYDGDVRSNRVLLKCLQADNRRRFHYRF